MILRRGTSLDVSRLSALRHALWPHHSTAAHQVQLEMLLAASSAQAVIFVAYPLSDAIVGFAEATIRHDYVNGCDSSPVAYLEGVYVEPKARRTGIARALMTKVEAWGLASACRELASDAAANNLVSHSLHAALGFEETERVVFFRKRIAG